MTNYSIEFAKSGRAKCKKCKEPIPKDALRIGVHDEDAAHGYDTHLWYHPKCFSLPRKLKQQGVTAESFVLDGTLKDDTEDKPNGDVLKNEEKRSEIIADIEYTKPRGSSTKKKKRGEEGYEPPKEGSIAKLKEMRDDMRGANDDDDDDEKKPPAKKLKFSEEDIAKVEIYMQHEKETNDQLHDILKWNRQLVSGTKDILMARVIDGQMHGRLGRCPLCVRGKLQLENEAAKNAICKGFFNEDIGARESCSFSCPIKDAPREHPWFTEKPSDEEIAAMDAESEALKSGSKVGDDDKVIAALEEKAEEIDWNLDNKEAIQKAVKDMAAVCLKAGIDLPEPTTAKLEIGKLVTSNRSLPPSEIAKLVAEKYGFADQNEAAAEKKQAAVENACVNPSNAEIVAVLLELSSLYFKDGNSNAGISYKKVSQAVSRLDFEITAENAKGLGKGKTKQDGIGKSSAEKIHEYLTTGKIQKLEEKRAALS